MEPRNVKLGVDTFKMSMPLPLHRRPKRLGWIDHIKVGHRYNHLTLAESVPKLLHGSNRDPLPFTELEKVVLMYRSTVAKVGIKDYLGLLHVSGVDLCIDAVVDDPTAYREAFDLLVKMPYMDEMEWDNKGEWATFYLGNGQRLIRCYDKFLQDAHPNNEGKFRMEYRLNGNTLARLGVGSDEPNYQNVRRQVKQTLQVDSPRFHMAVHNGLQELASALTQWDLVPYDVFDIEFTKRCQEQKFRSISKLLNLAYDVVKRGWAKALDDLPKGSKYYHVSRLKQVGILPGPRFLSLKPIFDEALANLV